MVPTSVLHLLLHIRQAQIDRHGDAVVAFTTVEPLS
jgi:hypothetical protein